MPLFPRAGVLRGEKLLGTYGVLGGEIELYGNWEPDGMGLSNAEHDILQLAGYLENTAEPLARSAAIARADTQHHFDTETDPDGNQWIALDQDYLDEKVSQGYPPDILQRTKDMMHAATAPGAWIVENDTLFFDPSSLPPYAMLHQLGNDPEGRVGEAAQRKLRIQAIRSEGARMGSFEAGGQRESLGIGRGQALPARPFIGLSADGVNEIASLFDLWFDEGVQQIMKGGQFYRHPGGTVQFRNPAGQFGRKIF